MDHNGVFTAEDNVDAVQRRKPDSKKMGEDTMTAAQGGVDNRTENEHSEGSPLLNTEGSGSGGSAGPPPYEEEVDYPKPDYNEWDHLPWWKRPSVCLAPSQSCV